MGRKINDVNRQIQAVLGLPDKWKKRLKSLAMSASLAAPEMSQFHWERLHELVWDDICRSNTKPLMNWQVEVLAIFLCKTAEETASLAAADRGDA